MYKLLHEVEHVLDKNKVVTMVKRRVDGTSIPKMEQRCERIKEVHDALVHPSADEMVGELAVRGYWWPDVKSDCACYNHGCDGCLRAGRLRKCRPMNKKFTATRPFGTICVDLIVGIKPDAQGNTVLLVVSDVFTRWCEAYPLKSKGSVGVVRKLVEEWMMRYGIPDVVISDEGGEFTSKMWEEVAELLRIKLHKSAPYHHKGNGVVERVNGSIMSKVRAAVVEMRSWKEWTGVLPYVLVSLRMRVHRALGMSPYEALFGIRGEAWENVDIEARVKAVQRLRDKITARMWRKMEKEHVYVGRNPKVGDIVFVQNETAKKSDAERFTGPYVVVGEDKFGGRLLKVVSKSMKKENKGTSFIEQVNTGGYDIKRNVNQLVLSETQLPTDARKPTDTKKPTDARKPTDTSRSYYSLPPAATR